MIAGALVGMRQSMSKFDSKTLSVEVCSVAKVMPCYINRQVIMALLSLGIHKDVFWNMYVEFVKELDRLLEGGPLALMVRPPELQFTLPLNGSADTINFLCLSTS